MAFDSFEAFIRVDPEIANANNFVPERFKNTKCLLACVLKLYIHTYKLTTEKYANILKNVHNRNYISKQSKYFKVKIF